MTKSSAKPELVVPAGHLSSKRLEFAVFTPNGQYLLTASGDQSLKLWNLEGKLIKTFRDDHIPAVAAFINEEEFITGYYNGTAKRWNLLSGATEIIFKDLGQEVIAISNDGNKIALYAGERSGRLSDINKQIGVWDVKTSTHTICDLEHEFRIEAIAFFHDNTKAVTASFDKTLRVWNISNGNIDGKAPGKLLHTLKGHQNPLDVVAVSPDDSVIISGGQQAELLVWDAKTGQKKDIQLSGHKKVIDHILFSPDGTYFLTACPDKIITWDFKTFTQKGTPISKTYYHRYVFSRDLTQVFRRNHPPSFIEMETGRTKHELQGMTCTISRAAISAKDDIIIIDSDDHLLRTWQFNTNQPTINYSQSKYIRDEKNFLDHLRLMPHTSELVLTDMLNAIMVLDKNSMTIQEEILCPNYVNNILDFDFSPDGKKIVVGMFENEQKEERDYTCIILNREGRIAADKLITSIGSKNILHKLKVSDNADPTDAVAFSNSGDKLLLAVRNGKVSIWDVESGQMEKSLVCGEEEYNSPHAVAWSSGDKKIAAAVENGWVYVWDIENNYERKGYHSSLNIASKKAGEGYVRAVSVTFSPDGSKLISAYYESRTFIIWDVETGEECKVIEDHLFGSELFRTLISFSEDGNVMFTSATGNAILLWDVHSGKKLASLYFLAQNDWAVTTPFGLFDASEGAMNMMHYVAGLEVIELEQLKHRYYEPGLLNKLLEQGEAGLRDVTTLDQVDLYPEVKARIKAGTLSLELKERSGGLGKVILYINHKAVWEDENKVGKKSFSIELKNFNKYFSTREENHIAVRVYNKAGWLVSPEIIPEYEDEAVSKAGREGRLKKGKRKRTKSVSNKLFALFVGTGKYRGSGMNLKYPEKDATMMADAIKAVGKNLFGEQNLDVRLFTTAETKAKKIPSKANIEAVFKDFAQKATADDVCFIYFSGHGDNWGQGAEAQFYYLTKDMISNDISDAAIRKTQTISSAEISNWTNTIACKLQVLVLDACHSGKLVDSLLGSSKAVDTARIRALDRMKDRTGMFVLAGSPGDKVSWETSHFGQGLLTYSLLFGIRGAAHVLEGSDKFVDVMKLLQYSRDRVPELAKEINKVQQPILATPKGGDSFDIGIFDEGIKIPIAARRPIIIQSILLDKKSYYDDLGLSDALDQRLLQENAFAATARLTFVNIPKFNNAYTVRGLYEVNGDQIDLDLKIFKDGEQKETLKIKKAKTDRNGIAEAILEKLAVLPV